jgi:hypothetical protein
MATRGQPISASTDADPLEAIRQVGWALLEHRAELGRAIAQRIAEDIPSYRSASPVLLEDVLGGSSATGELLARAFADGVELRREDVESVREVARRRVHQGVTLETFQHAYRAALSAFWDACTTREASLQLAGFALKAMDLVATQAAEAYVREDTRIRTQSGREARDLLELLISGQYIEDARRHPVAPGLDPAGQLTVVVGRIESTAIPVTDALQVARDALEEAMSIGRAKPLAAIRQGEIVLITPAGHETRRRTSLTVARGRNFTEHDVDIHYGVSSPAFGFPGVQRAYREATLSLSYSSSPRPIVALSDLSSLECALIGAGETTRTVIAAKGDALRGLPQEERTLTIDTVRAFAAADLNIARAAAAMHVHPNTVRYRLARIATTTGHDPKTFAGLVELICVLETITPDRPDSITSTSA